MSTAGTCAPSSPAPTRARPRDRQRTSSPPAHACSSARATRSACARPRRAVGDRARNGRRRPLDPRRRDGCRGRRPLDRARRSQRFRGLDILVNNAGVYGPMGAIEDVDWDEWVHAIEINLLGTVLLCRACHAAFHARSATARSSSSRAAARPSRCRGSAPTRRRRPRSCASPRRSRDEVQDVGIDVNAIAPGALNTRLLDEVLAAGPRAVGAGVLRASRSKQKQKAARRWKRGAAPVRVPRLRDERRHHRASAERGLGPWQNLPEPARRARGERRLHAAPHRPRRIAA